MVINYNEEVKRLDSFKPADNSEFWKPKPGQYKVKAITEMEDAEPYEEEGKDPKPRAKIDILVEDQKYTWTFTVGKSSASSYGQLCKLAVANGGKLQDAEFTIVVTSDGKKNNYTIVR